MVQTLGSVENFKHQDWNHYEFGCSESDNDCFTEHKKFNNELEEALIT